MTGQMDRPVCIVPYYLVTKLKFPDMKIIDLLLIL